MERSSDAPPDSRGELMNELRGLIGESLDGRYRLDEVIGIGGMGAVFRATHLIMGHEVAVKLMLQAGPLARERKERFLREARILSSIRSPHLAPVTDAAPWRNGFYLVMELLRGETLEQRYHRVSISESELAAIAFELCEGLKVAHDAGIVHRDLKASNVFLTTERSDRGLVRILDFGIAKEVGAPELTRTSMVVGSPVYMSPEQIASSRQVDARADIWSLGVMFYRVLGGKLPFEANGLTALALKIMHEEPLPLPSSVSENMREIIAKCMQKSRAARYQSVRELAFDLAKLSRDEAILPVTARVGEALPPTEDDPSAVPTTKPDPPGEARDSSKGPVSLTLPSPGLPPRPAPVALIVDKAAHGDAMTLRSANVARPAEGVAQAVPLGPIPQTAPMVPAYTPLTSKPGASRPEAPSEDSYESLDAALSVRAPRGIYAGLISAALVIAAGVVFVLVQSRSDAVRKSPDPRGNEDASAMATPELLPPPTGPTTAIATATAIPSVVTSRPAASAVTRWGPPRPTATRDPLNPDHH